MLRHSTFSINNFAMNVITQLLFQSLANHSKSAALIVGLQIFHVFQQKGSRAFGRDNTSHIKKQSALGVTGKTMLTAKGILFRYPGNRERLAGKTRK